MDTIRLKSYKIAPKIQLEKLVSFFRMEKSSIWREYVVISGPHLEIILKKKCDTMSAYLFEFGCITLVNFEEFDIQMFLEFLEGLVDRVDYAMFARYSESHVFQVDETSQFRPWKNSTLTFRYDESVIPPIAVVLAKSTALDKIEIDVGENMDESEKYIDYLRKGRLPFRKKALGSAVSGFVKFEFESINNIRIFDRYTTSDDSLHSRDIYDALSEYYELNDRFEVLQNKIGSFRHTIKTYMSLSYEKNENRLYKLEIFLLLLFPLIELIRLFVGKKGLTSIFNLISW